MARPVACSAATSCRANKRNASCAFPCVGCVASNEGGCRSRGCATWTRRSATATAAAFSSSGPQPAGAAPPQTSARTLSSRAKPSTVRAAWHSAAWGMARLVEGAEERLVSMTEICDAAAFDVHAPAKATCPAAHLSWSMAVRTLAQCWCLVLHTPFCSVQREQSRQPEHSHIHAGVADHTDSPGLLQQDGWEDMSVAEAAQAVQVSAFPDAYAQWEGLARQVVRSRGGGGGSTPQPPPSEPAPEPPAPSGPGAPRTLSVCTHAYMRRCARTRLPGGTRGQSGIAIRLRVCLHCKVSLGRRSTEPLPITGTTQLCVPYAENRCGSSYSDAEGKCSKCPGGVDAECAAGETCYAEVPACDDGGDGGGGGGGGGGDSPPPDDSGASVQRHWDGVKAAACRG